MTVQPIIPADWGWAYTIAVGQQWPQGNEDLLRLLAQAWQAAAQGVLAIAEDGTVAANAVTFAIQGPSADQFIDEWNRWVDGDDSILGQLATQFQELAGNLTGQATETEYTKLSINITVIIMLIQIAWAVAASIASLGASMGEAFAAIFIAREEVIRLVGWFVDSVVMMLMPDLITQSIMLYNGDEPQWDAGKTAMAAAMAVAGGLVGGGLGVGVGRALPFLAEAPASWGQRLAQWAGHAAQGSATNLIVGTGGALYSYATMDPQSRAWVDAHGGWARDLPAQAINGAVLGVAFSAPHTFGSHDMMVITRPDGTTLFRGRELPDRSYAMANENDMRTGTGWFDPKTGQLTTQTWLGDRQSTALEPGTTVTYTHDSTVSTYRVGTDGSTQLTTTVVQGHGSTTVTYHANGSTPHPDDLRVVHSGQTSEWYAGTDGRPVATAVPAKDGSVSYYLPGGTPHDGTFLGTVSRSGQVTATGAGVDVTDLPYHGVGFAKDGHAIEVYGGVVAPGVGAPTHQAAQAQPAPPVEPAPPQPVRSAPQQVATARAAAGYDKAVAQWRQAGEPLDDKYVNAVEQGRGALEQLALDNLSPEEVAKQVDLLEGATHDLGGDYQRHGTATAGSFVAQQRPQPATTVHLAPHEESMAAEHVLANVQAMHGDPGVKLLEAGATSEQVRTLIEAAQLHELFGDEVPLDRVTAALSRLAHDRPTLMADHVKLVADVATEYGAHGLDLVAAGATRKDITGFVATLPPAEVLHGMEQAARLVRGGMDWSLATHVVSAEVPLSAALAKGAAAGLSPAEHARYRALGVTDAVHRLLDSGLVENPEKLTKLLTDIRGTLSPSVPQFGHLAELHEAVLRTTLGHRVLVSDNADLIDRDAGPNGTAIQLKALNAGREPDDKTGSALAGAVRTALDQLRGEQGHQKPPLQMDLVVEVHLINERNATYPMDRDALLSTMKDWFKDGKYADHTNLLVPGEDGNGGAVTREITVVVRNGTGTHVFHADDFRSPASVELRHLVDRQVAELRARMAQRSAAARAELEQRLAGLTPQEQQRVRDINEQYLAANVATEHHRLIEDLVQAGQRAERHLTGPPTDPPVPAGTRVEGAPVRVRFTDHVPVWDADRRPRGFFATEVDFTRYRTVHEDGTAGPTYLVTDIALEPGEGVSAAQVALAKGRAEWAVESLFNGSPGPLDDGRPVLYRVRFVAPDPTRPDRTVVLEAGTGRATQRTWHTTDSGWVLGHELLHHFGARDEYFEPDALRPGATAPYPRGARPGLMGDYRIQDAEPLVGGYTAGVLDLAHRAETGLPLGNRLPGYDRAPGTELFRPVLDAALLGLEPDGAWEAVHGGLARLEQPGVSGPAAELAPAIRRVLGEIDQMVRRMPGYAGLDFTDRGVADLLRAAGGELTRHGEPLREVAHAVDDYFTARDRGDAAALHEAESRLRDLTARLDGTADALARVRDGLAGPVPPRPGRHPGPAAHQPPHHPDRPGEHIGRRQMGKVRKPSGESTLYRRGEVRELVPAHWTEHSRPELSPEAAAAVKALAERHALLGEEIRKAEGDQQNAMDAVNARLGRAAKVTAADIRGATELTPTLDRLREAGVAPALVDALDRTTRDLLALKHNRITVSERIGMTAGLDFVKQRGAEVLVGADLNEPTGANRFDIVAYDREHGRLLLVVEAKGGSSDDLGTRKTSIGTVPVDLQQGSALYLTRVLGIDSRLLARYHLEPHLLEGLQRGDIQVEYYRVHQGLPGPGAEPRPRVDRFILTREPHPYRPGDIPARREVTALEVAGGQGGQYLVTPDPEAVRLAGERAVAQLGTGEVRVTVAAGETGQGVLGRVVDRPGGGYTLLLDHRLPGAEVPRTVAHLVTELTEARAYHNRPLPPDALTPRSLPTSDTTLSPHDRGRLAELDVLAHEAAGATGPAERGTLQARFADLAGHLGLHPHAGDPAAVHRRALADRYLSETARTELDRLVPRETNPVAALLATDRPRADLVVALAPGTTVPVHALPVRDGVLTIVLHADPTGTPMLGPHALDFAQLKAMLPAPEAIAEGTRIQLLGCNMAVNDGLMHQLADHYQRVVVAADRPVWIDAAGNVIASSVAGHDLSGPRPRIPPDGTWWTARPGESGLHPAAPDEAPPIAEARADAAWHHLLAGPAPPTLADVTAAAKVHEDARAAAATEAGTAESARDQAYHHVQEAESAEAAANQAAQRHRAEQAAHQQAAHQQAAHQQAAAGGPANAAAAHAVEAELAGRRAVKADLLAAQYQKHVAVAKDMAVAQDRLATAARARAAAEAEVARHAQAQAAALVDERAANLAGNAPAAARARTALAAATAERTRAEAGLAAATRLHGYATREVVAAGELGRLTDRYAGLDRAWHEAGWHAGDQRPRYDAAVQAAADARAAAQSHAQEARSQEALAARYEDAGSSVAAQHARLRAADERARSAALLEEAHRHERDANRFDLARRRLTERADRLAVAKAKVAEALTAAKAEVDHARHAAQYHTDQADAAAQHRTALAAQRAAEAERQAQATAVATHTEAADRAHDAGVAAGATARAIDRDLATARRHAARVGDLARAEQARAQDLGTVAGTARARATAHDAAHPNATDQAVLDEGARLRAAATAAEARHQDALDRAARQARLAKDFADRADRLAADLTAAQKRVTQLADAERDARRAAGEAAAKRDDAEAEAARQATLATEAADRARAAAANAELAGRSAEAARWHRQATIVDATAAEAGGGPVARPLAPSGWRPPNGAVPLKVRGTDRIATYRLGPNRYATPVAEGGRVTHWEFGQHLPTELASKWLVPAGRLDLPPDGLVSVPPGADRVYVDANGDVLGYRLPGRGYVRWDPARDWSAPGGTRPPGVELPRAEPDLAALIGAGRRVPAGWVELFDGPEPVGYRDPNGFYYLPDPQRPDAFAWRVYHAPPRELAERAVAAVVHDAAARANRYASDVQQRQARWSPVWDRYERRVVAFWDGHGYQRIDVNPRTGELFTTRDPDPARYRDERYDHRPNETWKPVRFDTRTGRAVAWEGADVRGPGGKVWLLTHKHVADLAAHPTDPRLPGRRTIGMREVGRLPARPFTGEARPRPRSDWIQLTGVRTGRITAEWDGANRFRVFIENHRTGYQIRVETDPATWTRLAPRLRIAPQDSLTPVVNDRGEVVLYRRIVDGRVSGGTGTVHEYLDPALTLNAHGEATGIERHPAPPRALGTVTEVAGGTDTTPGWRPPAGWRVFVDQHTGGLAYYRHGDRYVVPRLAERRLLWTVKTGDRMVLEEHHALPAHLNDPRYVELPHDNVLLPGRGDTRPRTGALADAWFRAGRDQTTLELHDALRGWDGRSMDHSVRLLTALALRRLPGFHDVIDGRLMWPVQPVTYPLLHWLVNPLERLVTGRYHAYYEDTLGGRAERWLGNLGEYSRALVVETLPPGLHYLDAPRRFLSLGSGEATTFQRVHQPVVGTYRTSHGDRYLLLADTDPRWTRSFSRTAGERPSLRWSEDKNWTPGGIGGHGRLPLPGGGQWDLPWPVDFPWGNAIPDSAASFGLGTPIPLGLDTQLLTREATGQTRFLAYKLNGSGPGARLIRDFVPHDAVPLDQGRPQGSAPWRLRMDEGGGRLGISPIMGPSHSLLHNHPLPDPPAGWELPPPSKFPLYVYLKPVVDFGVGGVRAVSIWQLAGHYLAGHGKASFELRGVELAAGLSLSNNPVLIAQSLFAPLRLIDLAGQLGLAPWGTPVNDLAQWVSRATGGGLTWQWNPEAAAVLALPIDVSRPPAMPVRLDLTLPPGHDWRPEVVRGVVVGYAADNLHAVPVVSPVTGRLVGWEIT